MQPTPTPPQMLADLTAATAGPFQFWGSAGLQPTAAPPPGAPGELPAKPNAAARDPAGAPPKASGAAAAPAAGGGKPAGGTAPSGAPPIAAAAAAAASAQGDGEPVRLVDSNTGWTFAAEVAAGGDFKDAGELPPAARAAYRALREPGDLMGAGAGGGGGGPGPVGWASAVEGQGGSAGVQEHEEAEGGGGRREMSAAAKEALLARGSEEAMREVAARRAAKREAEAGAWAQLQAFKEAHKVGVRGGRCHGT